MLPDATQSRTPLSAPPPAGASNLVARILAVLLGAAALVGLGSIVNACGYGYSLLLVTYILIILAPLLVFLGWRLLGLWRLGWRRVPSRQARRAYLWTAVAFISVVVLVYSLESWRGRRAYAALKRDVARQGTTLDLAAVIPPTVPDGENFCATPLLRSMVDYEFEVSSPPFLPEGMRWRDPEAIRRLRELRVPARKPEVAGSWLRGEFTDLGAWATWIATNRLRAGHATTEQPAEAMLQALAGFEPELAELRSANQRPLARWPLRYQDGFFHQLGTSDRDRFLQNLVGILVLRAVANLELGRTDPALADWKLALRLAQSTKDEPLYDVHYQRLRLLSDLIQPLWEGLARQRWSDQQLIEVQTLLGQIDLPADWARAVRGEVYLYLDLARQIPVMFSLHTLFQYRRDLWSNGIGVPLLLGWLLYPRGWVYEDQVVMYRLYESQAAGRSLCCTAETPRAASKKAPRKPIDPLFVTFVYPRLRYMLVHTDSFCFAQFGIESARAACALERYRQKHGAFPASLDALLPQYLDKLPVAPGTQNLSLAYEPTADGTFMLRPLVELEPPHWLHQPKDEPVVWRYPARPEGSPMPRQ